MNEALVKNDISLAAIVCWSSAAYIASPGNSVSASHGRSQVWPNKPTGDPKITSFDGFHGNDVPV